METRGNHWFRVGSGGMNGTSVGLEDSQSVLPSDVRLVMLLMLIFGIKIKAIKIFCIFLMGFL